MIPQSGIIFFLFKILLHFFFFNFKIYANVCFTVMVAVAFAIGMRQR